VVYRLFIFDLAQIETLLIAFTLIEKKLVGFDVVQLVNEYPLPTIS
jgi:hypothetical protein